MAAGSVASWLWCNLLRVAWQVRGVGRGAAHPGGVGEGGESHISNGNATNTTHVTAHGTALLPHAGDSHTHSSFKLVSASKMPLGSVASWLLSNPLRVAWQVRGVGRGAAHPGGASEGQESHISNGYATNSTQATAHGTTQLPRHLAARTGPSIW